MSQLSKSLILFALLTSISAAWANPIDNIISGDGVNPPSKSKSKGKAKSGQNPKEILAENCEVVLTEGRALSTSSDNIEIPVFHNALEVSAYAEELRERLSHGAKDTAIAFNKASDRADDSLTAIKTSLVTGGDRNAQAIVELFLEFNKLGKRLAPPEKFSPSNVATETQSGFKGLMRTAMRFVQARGLEVPPTVEQWLAVYSAESPDFAKMRDQIQRALDDVAARSRAAHVEIAKLEDLVTEQEERKSDLVAEYNAHEANLANLDPETQEEVRLGILVPLARDINIINEYVGGHKAIIVQKKLILKGSEDVVEDMLPTVNLALPTLRNSAIAADDAMTNKRLAEATMELRDLTRRSLQHTSQLIHSTAKTTADLRSTAIVGPEALRQSVQELVNAAEVSQNALDRQLPNLKARMDQYDELSKEMSSLIRRIPTAEPLALNAPDSKK